MAYSYKDDSVKSIRGLPVKSINNFQETGMFKSNSSTKQTGKSRLQPGTESKKSQIKVEDINFILNDELEELPFEDYEEAAKVLFGQIWEQREKNLENKTNLSMVEVEQNQLNDNLDDLEIRYQESLNGSNDIKKTILDLSSRLEELGDFKVCLEASLTGKENKSTSSSTRQKKFLNDLDSVFLSLGLRRFETEGEVIEKNDMEVLAENNKLVEEKQFLEYELSKLFSLNLQKPYIQSKLSKLMKIEDHIKQKENQNIIDLIKKIN